MIEVVERDATTSLIAKLPSFFLRSDGTASALMLDHYYEHPPSTDNGWMLPVKLHHAPPTADLPSSSSLMVQNKL